MIPKATFLTALFKNVAGCTSNHLFARKIVQLQNELLDDQSVQHGFTIFNYISRLCWDGVVNSWKTKVFDDAVVIEYTIPNSEIEYAVYLIREKPEEWI